MATLTRGQHVYKWASGTLFMLILLVLYAPFLIMLRLSFGLQNISVFPPEGWSTISYQKLLNPSDYSLFTISGEPLTNYGPPLVLSLALAILTAVVATVLALMAALAFRKRFHGRGALFYLLLLGLVTPGVILGLGLRLFTDQMGFGAHWATTGLLVHVAWAMPFGFLVFLVFLNRFDHSIEEAAATLGASPWRVFRTITLPILSPAVLGSFLFGFTLSFDEVQRSSLVMGHSTSLPQELLAVTTVRVTPVVYALGSIIALASFLLVGVYLVVIERQRRRLSMRASTQEELPDELGRALHTTV
ncbi:MAG: ABC transporter permease subunit [Thermoleophilia bacterium]|nr:ABC transporter permease subunit [Thermoleophilia bacterium]